MAPSVPPRCPARRAAPPGWFSLRPVSALFHPHESRQPRRSRIADLSPAQKSSLYGLRTDKLGQNGTVTRQYAYKVNGRDCWGDYAATGVAAGAPGRRLARAARAAVLTSTIVMAMKIRPSVMAAPLT